MFTNLPINLYLIAGGLFLLGAILAVIIGKLLTSNRPEQRDVRDHKIRELEAELRIAQSNNNDSVCTLVEMEDKLRDTTILVTQRDNVITEQQSKLSTATTNLKEAVLQTRGLRSELADRATESLHAEAKIREVETELSVAQASADMIATGVLDYSNSPKNQTLDEVFSTMDDTPKKEDKA